MLKHVYRAIVVVAVFIGALLYFGQDMSEIVFKDKNTTKMSEATFPVVNIRVKEENINLLHGYANSIQSNLMRDSIVPMDSDQSMFLYISENESNVKKVNVEVRDTFDDALIDSMSYSALDKEKDQKTTKIKINQELVPGKEYAVTITLVTAESKKINYYTRIVKGNFYVPETVDFVMDLHKNLLDKKYQNPDGYFEPSNAGDNSSLNHVTTKSSLDLLTYGNLSPKVLSEVIPTIKEVSSDISSVELAYFIKGKTDSGTEVYQVKEFYRVKYTAGRMYLLDYERTIEAQFDLSLMSLNKGELKLGISNANPAQLFAGEESNAMCFVRNGELWYYNKDDKEAVCVFSFRQSDTDYIRDTYDQHEIKVLNMNAEGTIDFMVYGYMNRGSYEGRVGVIVYRFYASDRRIEELAYIPASEPYQLLRENIGKFAYLTYNDIFYFIFNNTIYSYNITTKKLDTLATNIQEGEYVFSKENSYLAWQVNKDNLAKSICIMELSTGSRREIKAERGENLKLLGLIDNNIIYGHAKDKNVYTSLDGSVITPVEEMYIMNQQGKVLKDYSKNGYYVIGAKVNGNVIELIRVRHGENGFVPAKSDFIMNEEVTKEQSVSITSRVTESTFTEHYISLNHGEALPKPKQYTTLLTVLNDETTLRLDSENLSNAYYVYAYGGILGKYESAGDAVLAADHAVGTVVNQNQQIVWKRGTRNSIASIELPKTVTSATAGSSYEACLQMMKAMNAGKRNQIAPVNENQALQKGSEEVGATLVNIAGVKLEQLEYYINLNRPVIAAKSNSAMVLIVGYDPTHITIVDPASGVKTKLTRKSAEEQFAEAGNIFISYVE